MHSNATATAAPHTPRPADPQGDSAMFVLATPIDFESEPVHGLQPVSAPGVSVLLRVELTQKEAAAALASFTVGLVEDDPHVTPADITSVLERAMTDVMLHVIREAVHESAESEREYPADAGFYAWCRRIVALAAESALVTAR
jgi:hypothetical protein